MFYVLSYALAALSTIPILMNVSHKYTRECSVCVIISAEWAVCMMITNWQTHTQWKWQIVSHMKIHCNKNTQNTMSSSALCETTASDFCVFVLHSAVTDTFVEMTDVLPVCMCAVMIQSNETTVYGLKIDCIAFLPKLLNIWAIFYVFQLAQLLSY